MLKSRRDPPTSSGWWGTRGARLVLSSTVASRRTAMAAVPGTARRLGGGLAGRAKLPLGLAAGLGRGGGGGARARAVLLCAGGRRRCAGVRHARLPARAVVLRQPALYSGHAQAGAVSRPAGWILVLPGPAGAVPQRGAGYCRAGRHGPGDGDSGLRGAAAVRDSGLGSNAGGCPGAAIGVRAPDGALRAQRLPVWAAGHDRRGDGAVAAGAAGAGMCAGRAGAGVRRPGSGAGRSAADPIRPVLVCPPGQARPGAAGPGGNGRDVRDAGDPAAGLRLVV